MARGTNRHKWLVPAMVAWLAVMLLVGAIVVVMNQHSARMVQPSADGLDEIAADKAAAQDSGPLRQWSDDTPDYRDLDVPDRPLPTTEPVYVPPPPPPTPRTDGMTVDWSEEPPPHSQPIRPLPAPVIAESPNAERERAEVLGSDKLPVALSWLADHQSKQGHWSPQKFREDSVREKADSTGNLHNWAGETDTGDEAATMRVSALALRAFIEAGYDHKAGDARHRVRSAILYFRRNQRNNGSFEGARGVRDHAAIAMSLMATYGLSGDAVLKPIVDRALDFLLAARVPGSGWRDAADGAPDIITTWFAVGAIHEARMCGLEVETDELFRDVGALLDSLVVGTVTMHSAAEHADAARPCITAAAWVDIALLIAHCEPSDPRIVDRVAEIAAFDNRPEYRAGRVDYLYWVIGTHALGQASQEHFNTWKTALRQVLSENRRGQCAEDVAADRVSPATLAEHGSWDAVDQWLNGGRVEATALAALAEARLDWHDRTYTRLLRRDSQQD